MSKRVWALLAVLVTMSVPAAAQQRPLVTEDPETIGSGLILLEGGFDVQHDITYPASGLNGNLLRLPTLGVSSGVSSIAELQIDGGLYNRLDIKKRVDGALAKQLVLTGTSTSDVEDIVVATKIRVLSETRGRPAIGLRFATKLPNASNENGLGLDTTDFYASLLFGKTVQSVRMVGNAGLGILGDPTRGDRQNDVLTYGLSFARAITQAGEVVGEVNGRVNMRDVGVPPGTESRSVARLGARYTVGSLRGDAAVFFGLTSRDPSVGVTAGFTYVFTAFQIP